MTNLSGSRRSLKAEPNVTPLIDVLLVLLIIFLVVTPTRSKGLNTSVPQETTRPKAPALNDDIVLSVLRDHKVMLNREPMALADLSSRLRLLFSSAPDHVLFIRGERELDFQQVAEVIDVAKGAGVNRIGLMTK